VIVRGALRIGGVPGDRADSPTASRERRAPRNHVGYHRLHCVQVQMQGSRHGFRLANLQTRDEGVRRETPAWPSITMDGRYIRPNRTSSDAFRNLQWAHWDFRWLPVR
jgi:hypothetical protein